MKKYAQITLVLGLFFAGVFLKKVVKSDDEELPVKNASSITPTITPFSTQEPSTQPSTNNLPTATSTPEKVSPTPSSAFKDGSYTGSTEDAFYGYIQVKAIITGGKLSNIEFLQYPNDNSTSLRINEEALPMLRTEAISAQGTQIDAISGASDTSPAFIKSLANALAQAKK